MREPRADELPSKSVGQRFLYYSGGVLMNVAFALVVLPLVFASIAFLIWWAPWRLRTIAERIPQERAAVGGLPGRRGRARIVAGGLDGLAVVDVEAGDHPDGEAHARLAGSVRARASSRLKRPS